MMKELSSAVHIGLQKPMLIASSLFFEEEKLILQLSCSSHGTFPTKELCLAASNGCDVINRVGKHP